MLPGKSHGETKGALAHCPPPIALAVTGRPWGEFERARASLPPPSGGAEGWCLDTPFFCLYRIAEEELASLLHGNRSEKTQQLLRLSKLPLSEQPGWRKGNSTKHVATFVLGMPWVSASLWGRLNLRKDTRASPYPSLKPRWPSASPIPVPGTASHTTHEPDGILVFPWGCHLPPTREQTQISHETKSTGHFLLLQKRQKAPEYLE